MVESLQRHGLIVPAETTREGRRPERTVYAPTPTGRTEIRAVKAAHDMMAEQGFPRLFAVESEYRIVLREAELEWVGKLLTTLSRPDSGGMQRKLDVAMGLVHRPQVLFLDEPTAGLDPQAVLAALDHAGIRAASVTVARPSLDDVHLRHTGRVVCAWLAARAFRGQGHEIQAAPPAEAVRDAGGGRRTRQTETRADRDDQAASHHAGTGRPGRRLRDLNPGGGDAPNRISSAAP